MRDSPAQNEVYRTRTPVFQSYHALHRGKQRYTSMRKRNVYAIRPTNSLS